MTRRNGRVAAAVGVTVALFVVIVRAVALLPHYAESRGPYEQRRAIESVRASHVTNLDAFINFDLRGFDTLGEEFIFLVAIAGFSLILSERRGEITELPRDPIDGRQPRDREVEVAVGTYIYVPIALTFGLYVVVHGQLTPGGGFQGGVALASGLLAIALALGFSAFARFAPKDGIEAVEAIGALSYVVLGVTTLAISGVFLRNVLPHGDTGSLLSSGTIIVLNDGVGVAIVAGFVVLFAEFLKEMAQER